MTGSVVEYIVILVFLAANIRGTSMLEFKTSKCFNLATTVILAVQSAWELSHPVRITVCVMWVLFGSFPCYPISID